MGINFGGLNPFNAVAQLALGAMTGGTSLLVQAAMTKLMSSIGQQIIQQLGEKLGLPQSAIDMAQSAFCTACGDKQGARTNMREALGGLSGALNLKGAEAGQFQREVGQAANQTVDDVVQQLIQQRATETRDEEGNVKNGKSIAASGGSWLHMIAEVMGNKLNKMANDMKAGADALDWKDPKAATKFQADMQAFNLNFNTVTSAIKTFGEALGNAARKQ